MGDLKLAILATNLVLVASTLAAITCRVGRRVFLVRSFSWHDGEPRFGLIEHRETGINNYSSHHSRRHLCKYILHFADGVYALRPWGTQH
jgi:hypothetical protein